MNPQLAERSAPCVKAILEHVARYRLSVPDALRREPALSGLSMKLLKRLLNHTCREGLLSEATLYHKHRYYYRPAGEHDELHRGPLSEPAKVRAYAVLAFCCLGNARRKRLTAEELAAHFPDLFRPGLPGAYYVAAADPPRIGLALIDAGGHGRWDRVLARLRVQLEEHCRHPALKSYVLSGRFEISILTALPQKAKRLAQTMAQWGDPRTKHVRIALIPELIHLIAPIPKGGR